MNRADAIALDELAKNKECRKCVGIDASRFSTVEQGMRQSNLIAVGEFLVKAMEQLSGGDYIAAEKKLAEIIDKL